MIKCLQLPKEPFTVLISGGIDSIAAAHWLKVKYRKEFSILHFNHNVQEANAAMEDAVSSFAKNFDILDYCVFTRKDVYYKDLSENGLREFRLSAMSEIGGNFITAHHLNDCVENYLDNCLKGTPEYKPIQESTAFDNFTIFHPFLTTTKQDFINYVNENDLNKFIVNDPTNSENDFKRNWIRNKLAKEIYDRNIGIEKVVLKKFYLQ